MKVNVKCLVNLGIHVPQDRVYYCEVCNIKYLTGSNIFSPKFNLFDLSCYVYIPSHKI